MKKLSHSLFLYIMMLYAVIFGVFILSVFVVAALKGINYQMIYKLFFILLTICTILFSKMVSKRFIKPLKSIVDGIYNFQKGNYDYRIQLKDNNEYALVASSLNEMARNIKGEKSEKKQLELDKEQLVMDISHDLKNPLASVLGYTSLLKHRNDEMTKEELDNYLEIIHRNANRANSLISDLFMYNKMETVNYNVTFQKIDLCQFVREIVMNYLPELESKLFDYDFEIPEKPCIVDLSVNDFNRAIGNLISNAITYNKEGTTLKIKVKEGSCFMRIIVEDNGVGIPKSMRETIFHPFKRVDPARNSNTGGSGLGLSITKKIVEIHNGRISLISEAGQGSKFLITVPKVQE